MKNYSKHQMNRIKTSYTAQMDMMDCGTAALSSVLKYHGSYYSLATLRELAKTSKQGTTALGIITAASKLGMDTKAIHADQSLFKSHDLNYPFIAHVIKAETFLHYYVIYGIYDQHLLIGDPDPKVKLKRVTLETFLREWTGVALLLTPSETYTPFKEIKHSLSSYISHVSKHKSTIGIILFTSLIASLISICSTFYLQQLLDYYIPQKKYIKLIYSQQD